MALAYKPPGTAVSEIVSPTISPLLATPTSVCLVGLAAGTIIRTDSFTLNGTTPVPLPGLPQGSTLNSVDAVLDALDPTKGAANGSGYTVTTDYTISTANGTITRVSSGAIADGALINVTYEYVPSDYFDPIRLDSLGAVESRFGSSYTSSGNAIGSPLSYAAGIAFENGASDVVLQPLFARATPGDPTTTRSQPTTTQAASSATWSDTLYILRDIEDINVIVPIVGQSMTNVGDAQQLAILQTVQDHIKFMKTEDQYIIGIFGEDSSAASNVAQLAILTNHASTLASRYAGDLAEQTVFVSPAKFARALPLAGQAINVGGQYVAAAIAGMLAARPVSAALTRRQLSGFTGVQESRTKNQKNIEAAAGLMVIEQKNQAIQVRHSITLDSSRTDRRELSVVRAKHFMIESVRDTIERQIIGQVIADGNAPFVVRSTVIGVLELLRQGRDLVDYSDVAATSLSNDPTVIEIRFSYRPAFPLNFVNIVFSVDLTTGDVVPTDPTIPSTP